MIYQPVSSQYTAGENVILMFFNGDLGIVPLDLDQDFGKIKNVPREFIPNRILRPLHTGIGA